MSWRARSQIARGSLGLSSGISGLGNAREHVTVSAMRRFMLHQSSQCMKRHVMNLPRWCGIGAVECQPGRCDIHARCVDTLSKAATNWRGRHLPRQGSAKLRCNTHLAALAPTFKWAAMVRIRACICPTILVNSDTFSASLRPFFCESFIQVSTLVSSAM